MKVTHRRQVHVQLTGHEADNLLVTLESFVGSSRLESATEEELATFNDFLTQLSEWEVD